MTVRLSALFAVALVIGAAAATIVSSQGVRAEQTTPATAPATATPSATPTTAATPTAESAAATTTEATATAEGATDMATTEAVDNPYGLDALWKGGDIVARGTLIILVIMSMGSWYIMVTKFFEQFRLGKQGNVANSTFWTARSVEEGVKTLKEGSPFRFIAESGAEATKNHTGALIEKIDLNTWVSMSIQRAVDNVSSRLQDGLSFLATVGSTAPFVGLFGTVWGIYHALVAIGIAGQASIDKVAGPVGEALIMTAIGLAVAVPAVLGYNWLVRRNKTAMESVRAFSADLHSVLLSGVPHADSNYAKNG